MIVQFTKNKLHKSQSVIVTATCFNKMKPKIPVECAQKYNTST